MRVLFVSQWFPYPPIHGSKQRVYHLLRALAERHQVLLLSFADHPSMEPTATEIRALCTDIEVVPWQSYQPWSARALLGLVARTPRSILATYSTRMAQCIRRHCTTGDYAVVVASQLSAASYHGCFHGVPALFDEVELGVFHDLFQNAPRATSRWRHWLTWIKLRRYVARVLREMRACTVVSTRERTLLRRAVPTAPRVEVIPNGTSMPPADTARRVCEEGTLVFTGALSYAANYDAMRWFLDAVYPTIKAQRPTARLTITGENGGHQLCTDGVVQIGHVPDVRPIVSGAAVSIAPIVWGGGTRLKVLEAMAVGTPVVATTKAVEGLDVVDGEHALIADDPKGFARHTLTLLGDRALRQRLADNARRLVADRYDWDGIGPRFVQLVEEVADAGRRT
jgi:sugar transferase (PEP-CTERM/EpsH1 system associated)